MKIKMMWVTDKVLYEYDDSGYLDGGNGFVHARQSEKEVYELEGRKYVDPELKYVVLDSETVVNRSILRDNKEVHAVLNTGVEAKYYIFDSNKDFYKNKIATLIKDKEKELNVKVMDVEFDEDMNLHVLVNRLSDDSHAVWTSFFSEEKEKCYADFYNGEYDMNIEEGKKVLERRSGHYTDIFIGHNEMYVLDMTELEGIPFGKKRDHETGLVEYYDTVFAIRDKIKELGVKPLKSSDGFANVHTKNKVVYSARTGRVGEPSEFVEYGCDPVTWKILNNFYEDNIRYWRDVEKVDDYVDKALADLENVTNNPYSPFRSENNKLDEYTKEHWLEGKKEMENERISSKSYTLQYVKESACLFLKTKNEVVDYKFYNTMETPRNEVEKEEFVQRLQMDARQMLKLNDINSSELDLSALGISPKKIVVKQQQKEMNMEL